MHHFFCFARLMSLSVGLSVGLSVILSVITFLLPSFVFAFTFGPSQLEMSPSETQPSRTYSAENPGDRRIAIQLSVHARVVDEEGAEQLPATTDFTIFPQQLILKPKESRVVRITYVGPKKVGREVAYRVVAEQMPVDLKEKDIQSGARLKFLIKYQTSVYVRPDGAKPQLKVESVRAIEKTGKDRELELMIVNDGMAHKMLAGATLRLTAEPAGGAPKTLSGTSTKPLETINILAGARRRVVLPWPKDLPVTNYTAQLVTE